MSALKLLDISSNNKIVFSKFSVSKIKCMEESSGYEDQGLDCFFDDFSNSLNIDHKNLAVGFIL